MDVKKMVYIKKRFIRRMRQLPSDKAIRALESLCIHIYNKRVAYESMDTLNERSKQSLRDLDWMESVIIDILQKDANKIK